MIQNQFAIILAFILGSIPFGVFVAKLFGVKNLRSVGSGNIGATNVTRAAGFKAGVITYLLDFLKAFLPMFYLHCSPNTCGSQNVWIGFAAILGHCFSPFLRFNGGKGVATTFGFLFALDYRIGLACGLVYLLTLIHFRISAIGSLLALIVGFICVSMFRENTSEKLSLLFITLIVLHRHKSNWIEIIQKTTVFLFIPFLFLCPNKTFAYNKIIALMPSISETIIDLGAGERLIATTDHSNIPDLLKKK